MPGAPAMLQGNSSIMVASAGAVTVPKLSIVAQKIPEILKPLPESKEEDDDMPQATQTSAIQNIMHRLKPQPIYDEKVMSFSLKPSALY